jgi:hypothetical protein
MTLASDIDDPSFSKVKGGGLYVLWLSDEHYYGGRTRRFRARWREHLKLLSEGTHENVRMQAVFDLNARFHPTILSRITDSSQRKVVEQAWIDENFRKPGCLNLSHSSEGGCAFRSEETRAKMSLTRAMRPDLVEKARASLKENGRPFVKGMKHPAEHVRKNADAHRGKKQSPDHIAKRVAANLGRKNTPETLAQMSESAKRRAKEKPTVHSSGTKALISSQQKGRIWVHNGERNERIWPLDFPRYENEGFVRGKKPYQPRFVF